MGRPTPLVRTPVPGAGPYSALILHVGEGAGPQEAARGIPWIGPSGQVVRSAYKDAGLMVDRFTTDHVRFNNVVPHNPGRLTDGYRKSLVREHWDNISMDLARGDYRVIVACGGVALQRLTGLSNIKEEHGGVIRVRDLPRAVLVAGEQRDLGYDHLLTRNPDLVVVACEHPASVMQGDKTQGRMIQVRRALGRAARIALRQVRGVNALPEIVVDFADEQLDKVLAESSYIAVDTEFKRETHEPLAVQLCGNADPGRVYIFDPNTRTTATALAAKYLSDTRKLKFAHYTPADIGTFRRLGYDISGGDGWPNWLCTLHIYSALYPDTLVGLNHVTLDLLDDQRNWKELNTLDPVYMALDVWNCLRVGVIELDEVVKAGMVSLVRDEISVAVCEMDKLERGGMRVDEGRRHAMIEDYREREKSMTAVIQQSMADTFARRGARVKRKLDEIEALLGERRRELGIALLRCKYKRHESYDGLRLKKWIADEACTCKAVYDQVSALVEREPLRPFSPTNDHDMKWLLYDKDGLGLPVQKSRDTGNQTVDAGAIQKIVVKMADVFEEKATTSSYYRANAPAIIAFIKDCKAVKQLRKHRVTFLEIEVDSGGYAHPGYRAYGAGTGRPAGGGDDVLDDDQDQSASFNALNIPKALREIYVPDREDWVWVCADYSALESWTAAHCSGDETLWRELSDYVAGRGPKPHALNAALLYDIDVKDVKRVMVPFQGNVVPAYDNGKRVSHLYSFGGTEHAIAGNLWISTARALTMIAKLDAKYVQQVAYRQRLADAVFGTRSFVCQLCGHVDDEEMNCPKCLLGGRNVELVWGGWATMPTRVHYTRFGRRRHYWGRRKDAAKALASQEPQSHGASIFYRTSARVNGYEMVDGVRVGWPTPGVPGVDYRYATGSYDSFAVCCRRDEWSVYARWLAWTMEQPWSQLDGMRVPAEVSVGMNLAPWDEVKNPRGLYELPWTNEQSGDWTPLRSTREMWDGAQSRSPRPHDAALQAVLA